MKGRKPLKLEEVEWDGLLLFLVLCLNRVLPMERILNTPSFLAVADFVKRYNPCHGSEDSFGWRLMCFLFPDCWCCSGLRGVIYGVILSALVVTLWRLF